MDVKSYDWTTNMQNNIFLKNKLVMLQRMVSMATNKANTLKNGGIPTKILTGYQQLIL